MTDKKIEIEIPLTVRVEIKLGELAAILQQQAQQALDFTPPPAYGPTHDQQLRIERQAVLDATGHERSPYSPYCQKCKGTLAGVSNHALLERGKCPGPQPELTLNVEKFLQQTEPEKPSTNYHGEEIAEFVYPSVTEPAPDLELYARIPVVDTTPLPQANDPSIFDEPTPLIVEDKEPKKKSIGRPRNVDRAVDAPTSVSGEKCAPAIGEAVPNLYKTHNDRLTRFQVKLITNLKRAYGLQDSDGRYISCTDFTTEEVRKKFYDHCSLESVRLYLVNLSNTDPVMVQCITATKNKPDSRWRLTKCALTLQL